MSEHDSGARSPIIAGAETIDLQGEGSSGVLLLHGFGDTPQTLGLLARRLHSSGYSVQAPLLPGHGRTMADFLATGADDWTAAATSGFHRMRQRHSRIALVGLSMGGALAVIAAAGVEDLPALVLIAPYLEMPRRLRVAAATRWFWGRLAGEVNARNVLSVRDPIEREKNLAYGSVTGRALHELARVVRRARNSLADVRAPTLLIQSRSDPRCSTGSAERAFKALGAREKKLVWTAEGGHIITVDYGRERVFAEVSSWLETHSKHGATAAEK